MRAREPDGLMRLGWTRTSLSEGDEITVDGFRARDRTNHLNTQSVIRSDGKKMFTGAGVQGGLR